MSALPIDPERARMERAWRTAAEPIALLTTLDRLNHFAQPWAVRKLRLFACALIREVWPEIADGRIHLACQTAELFAAGRGELEDAQAAYESAKLAERWAEGFEGSAGMLAMMATSPKISSCLANWKAAADQAARLNIPACRQAAILRCQFEPFSHQGGPGNEAVKMLRTSQGCMVLSIAMGISRGRRFAELPWLADQLEAAGLGDCELLRHLRGLHRCAACLDNGLRCTNCSGRGWLELETLHVGGCWALEVLLGFSSPRRDGS